MTRIIILSDTHGLLDEAVLKHLHWADELWHAGDFGSLQVAAALSALKPLRGVYGNIDGADILHIYPKEQYFSVEGVSVFMTHIAGTPARYGAGVLARIKELAPKVVVCGHSHILKVMYSHAHGHLHINPGAAGKFGAQQVRTLIRLEIDGADIQNMEVVEIPL